VSDSVRRHLSVPVSRQGVPYGKALGGDGERAGMKVPISGYARIEMDAPVLHVYEANLRLSPCVSATPTDSSAATPRQRLGHAGPWC
jgi:hypothetical protein